MSLWVLDTDTLTLWLRGQESIAAHIAVTPPQQIAVTSVTVEECSGGGTPKSDGHAMMSSLLGLIKRSNKMPCSQCLLMSWKGACGMQRLIRTAR
jgi:hypothetical protein